MFPPSICSAGIYILGVQQWRRDRQREIKSVAKRFYDDGFFLFVLFFIYFYLYFCLSVIGGKTPRLLLHLPDSDLMWSFSTTTLFSIPLCIYMRPCNSKAAVCLPVDVVMCVLFLSVCKRNHCSVAFYLQSQWRVRSPPSSAMWPGCDITQPFLSTDNTAP